ncbi:MAG: hypothetical protein SFW66_03045 [Gammaproteobacteria bacterium]|nr:hypothetical protein [Gammaproteobacteria bacterium]
MTEMPYTIRFAPKIANQLRKLPIKQRRLVLRFAEALAINPRPPGASRIEGMTGLYLEALESLNLNLIYKIEEQTVLLLFMR